VFGLIWLLIDHTVVVYLNMAVALMLREFDIIFPHE